MTTGIVGEMAGMLQPGDVVGERYRLDRLLGSGGMGMVWAATHTITHKPVALKFLLDTKADATARQRFLREARAACAVRHPNVVAIHDVLETREGLPLMVMDLLDGESLAQRLAREGPMPLPEVARVILPVVSAVGTAHSAGVVHRDLKPDNIFLSRSSDGRAEVKVLDFGIAKLTALEGLAASTSALTADGGLLGTPHYMSPEQVDGEKDIDYRTDVWSLGIIMYECLTGNVPTDGYNVGQVMKSITRGTFKAVGELRADLPPAIASLVMRMLSRDRADRPSLRELAEALQPFAAMDVKPFGDPVTVTGSGNVRIIPSDPRLPPAPLTDPSLGDAATLAAQTKSSITMRSSRGPMLAIAGGVVAMVIVVAVAGLAIRSRLRPAIAAPAPSVTETVTSTPATTTIATAPPTATAAPIVEAADAGAIAVAGHGGKRPPAHPPGAATNAAPHGTASSDRPGGVFEKPPF